MTKYIIFDFGGVIFDSGTSKAIHSISHIYKISEKQVAGFLTESSQVGTKYRTGEITREEFWTQAIASWGKTLDPVALNDIWVSGYSLRQEMVPILSGLKKNGYILGVLSNTVLDRFEYFKTQLALNDYFDAMVLSFRDHVLKPQKEAFLLILKKLGVENPEEAVYIDDKEIHAGVAGSLGMQAIVCKNAIQLSSDLRKLGVKI